MTPAQAAQQHNRDRGGRYQEKTHDEHSAFVPPTPASGSEDTPETVQQTPLERGYYTVAELYDYEQGRGPKADVMSATSVKRPPKDPRFNSVRVTFAGEGYVRAATGMAASTYEPLNDTAPQWEHLDSHKVTILARNNSGDVTTRQGTVVHSGDRPVLINKGSSSAGIHLDDSRLEVLKYKVGYNKGQELADEFIERVNQMPATEPVSLTGIPSDEDNPFGYPTAAFVFDHPGIVEYPDSATPGCVFIATDITENGSDSIINGYFWAPQDATLESEWSSMHLSDLKNPARGAARLLGKLTMNPHAPSSSATPKDRADMYRWLGEHLEGNR